MFGQLFVKLSTYSLHAVLECSIVNGLFVEVSYALVL